MSYRKEKHFQGLKSSFKQSNGANFNDYSDDQLAALWHETLENGMHGICFSMYEDGQGPGDNITPTQVRRRVRLLRPYTKWIRSFSCLEGNEHVPRIAKENGLKTMVGAWLGHDRELNDKEIEALIQLGKEGVIDIAAVGNEVLYRGDLTEEALLGYIHKVKEALPEVTVGYVDAYYEFTEHPRLTAACDVVLSNCYPFWEGCPIDYALNHMQSMYGQALAAGKGKKVIITETGWPSEGGSFEGAAASRENAMKYFIDAQAWSAKEDIEMFYFSSFDESWKTGDEGDVGAYWGLWDKDEKLKF